jgi:hypothetical protein
VAPRQSVPRPILSRIVVPLTLPGITAAGLFGFINACGALLVPLILVVNPSRQRAALVFPQLTTDTHVLYGDIAAYRLIYALPVLVLYLLVVKDPAGHHRPRARWVTIQSAPTSVVRFCVCLQNRHVARCCRTVERCLTAEIRIRIPVAVSTKYQQIPRKRLAARSNRGPIPRERAPKTS